jgi:hypothetical protein
MIRLVFSLLIIIGLNACHPGYKRLTRGKWYKDTLWVKFPDLPKPIIDTLDKYYQALFTKDTIDDISGIISLDPSRKITEVAYYNMNSKKFRLPFGWYFKIGKKKYFIDYSEFKTPLIYYDNVIYYKSGQYFDPNLTPKMRTKGQPWPYDKMYYVKYNLGKK